jgi:hypothetical protein
MAIPTLISAAEFMDMLKTNGLVIVSMAEHEAAKDYAQKRALRKKSLSCKEIADLELLGTIGKKTIQRWVETGKIKAHEWYRESGGCERIMILTLAIKRLRNED